MLQTPQLLTAPDPWPQDVMSGNAGKYQGGYKTLLVMQNYLLKTLTGLRMEIHRERTRGKRSKMLIVICIPLGTILKKITYLPNCLYNGNITFRRRKLFLKRRMWKAWKLLIGTYPGKAFPPLLPPQHRNSLAARVSAPTRMLYAGNSITGVLLVKPGRL